MLVWSYHPLLDLPSSRFAWVYSRVRLFAVLIIFCSLQGTFFFGSRLTGLIRELNCYVRPAWLPCFGFSGSNFAVSCVAGECQAIMWQLPLCLFKFCSRLLSAMCFYLTAPISLLISVNISHVRYPALSCMSSRRSCMWCLARCFKCLLSFAVTETLSFLHGWSTVILLTCLYRIINK